MLFIELNTIFIQHIKYLLKIIDILFKCKVVSFFWNILFKSYLEAFFLCAPYDVPS